jgi:putative cell wall-binding protein
LGTTYSFLIGQTQREFNAYRDTSDSILDCVTKITLMCGPEPITDCAVEGLADSYYYTGDQICPDFVLTDTDGNVLQKDIDYTVTYGENEEAGTGTITVEGMGYYGKSMELEFNIVRLHELAGNDRVTTAAAIALNTYPQGSAGVIVASGSTAPDALSAAGLSGALGYPILLNTGTGLSTVTEQAIVALSDGVEDFEIIVMGGESAVSASAYNALSKYVQNEYYITRLDGQTRYETSAVAWLYGSSRGLWSDTAIVVTGTNYPDALSIAAYSAWSSSPILLCPGNELGSSVKNALQLGGFKHVVIVGGTGAVSDSAMSEAAAIVNDVIRLGGNTRYATNLKVAKWCLEQGMTLQGCAIATGQNFPDALAGASLLGKNGSVILLANDADTSALSLLGETDEDINEVFVFGKTGSVSQKVRDCALKLLGWS